MTLPDQAFEKLLAEQRQAIIERAILARDVIGEIVADDRVKTVGMLHRQWKALSDLHQSLSAVLP